MELQEILSRLCGLPGPGGFESRVAEAAGELLRPLVDEISVDRMGSLVGLRRCGRPGAETLVLDAHLDEVGLLVTGEEEGFLRFTTLGGVDPRMLPDREVWVCAQPPLPGVVTCMPPHLQKREEADKALDKKDLRIDVGLSAEEAGRRVPPGTPVTFRGSCAPLGDKLLVGKALDDRAGFVVLIRAAQLLAGEELDVNLLILGSSREELNSAGAITALWREAPACCVAVDVTHGATPDEKDNTFPLGDGPVIGVGPNCTDWMSRRFFRKARELGLKVQTEVMAGSSGTNAWPAQISREGIATAVLSVPLRYMHSPVEVVHREDVEQTAQLLAAFVRGLGKEAHHA